MRTRDSYTLHAPHPKNRTSAHNRQSDKMRESAEPSTTIRGIPRVGSPLDSVLRDDFLLHPTPRGKR